MVPMIKVPHKATLVPTIIMNIRLPLRKIHITRTVVMAAVRLHNFLLHRLQPALVRAMEIMKVRLKIKTEHKGPANYREIYIPIRA